MDVPDLPERIEKPTDWVIAVQHVVQSAILAYPADPKFEVGKVKYRTGGGQAGPDEVCLGVLSLDAAGWVPTTDPWPTPRQPAGPADPCGSASAMTVAVRYVTCVSSPTNRGGPPPIEAENTEQLAIMDLAWWVYERLLAAEQRRDRDATSGGEFKNLGKARTGNVGRLAVESGGSGFTVSVQCKLGRGCK